MKTIKAIKVNDSKEVPEGYTGIVEFKNGNKAWYKNQEFHREDGPAWIRKDCHISWYLDGKIIWYSSNNKPELIKQLDLTNKTILSKSQHPLYPTVQVWKILDKNRVYEQIIIPGMEELIIE